MAYFDGEYLLTVRGNLPSGEVWANTWCVYDSSNTLDPQQALDHLRQMYLDISADLSNDWNAASASIKNLFTGVTFPGSWTTVTGTETSDNLPTECAVRLSFDDGQGANGGPFICGFVEDALHSTGILLTTVQGTLVDGIEALNLNLGTDGWSLHIHRPSVTSTVPVVHAKVGRVFDVIRRRRSAIAEDYAFAVL